MLSFLVGRYFMSLLQSLHEDHSEYKECKYRHVGSAWFFCFKSVILSVAARLFLTEFYLAFFYAIPFVVNTRFSKSKYDATRIKKNIQKDVDYSRLRAAWRSSKQSVYSWYVNNFSCHSTIGKFLFEISVNFRFYSSTSEQHYLLEKEIIMDQLQHLIIELLPFSLPHEWDSWCFF
jgi:hypothetical protein